MGSGSALDTEDFLTDCLWVWDGQSKVMAQFLPQQLALGRLWVGQVGWDQELF